jgi:hypothetical protein
VEIFDFRAGLFRTVFDVFKDAFGAVRLFLSSRSKIAFYILITNFSGLRLWNTLSLRDNKGFESAL